MVSSRPQKKSHEVKRTDVLRPDLRGLVSLFSVRMGLTFRPRPRHAFQARFICPDYRIPGFLSSVNGRQIYDLSSLLKNAICGVALHFSST
ncbi:MAG: hypothetical protein ACLFOY_09000, partial [Desulfatibacillaceae bacterium]